MSAELMAQTDIIQEKVTQLIDALTAANARISELELQLSEEHANKVVSDAVDSLKETESAANEALTTMAPSQN